MHSSEYKNQFFSGKKFTVSNILIIASIIVFLIALSVYAYIGTFARLSADDYGIGLGSRGRLFQYTIDMYNNWMGRFTSIPILAISLSLGTAHIPYITGVLLILWLLGTTWITWNICLIIKLPQPKKISLFLSSLIVFASVAGSPYLIESLYWQGASLQYTGYCVSATFYIGFLLWMSRTPPSLNTFSLSNIFRLGPSCCLAFFTGGFSEPSVVAQVAAMFLATAYVWMYRQTPKAKHIFFPILFAGLIGSLLALGVVGLAPGNKGRMNASQWSSRQQGLVIPSEPDFYNAVQKSPLYAFQFVTRSFKQENLEYQEDPTKIPDPSQTPATPLMVLLFAAMVAFRFHVVPTDSDTLQYRNTIRWLLVLTPIAGFILIAAYAFPGFYGAFSPPPPRVAIIAQWIMVVTLAIWGYLFGIQFQVVFTQANFDKVHSKFLVLLVAIMLLALSPVSIIKYNLDQIPKAKVAVEKIDTVAKEIQKARLSPSHCDDTVFVAIPGGTGSLWTPITQHPSLLENPMFIYNDYAAKYFGLKAIAILNKDSIPESTATNWVADRTSIPFNINTDLVDTTNTPQIRVLGYSTESLTGGLKINLYMEPSNRMKDYHIWMQAAVTNTTLLATENQNQGFVAYDSVPTPSTSWWQTGCVYKYSYTMTDLQPGRYYLSFGFHDPDTKDTLIHDNNDPSKGRIDLGWHNVTGETMKIPSNINKTFVDSKGVPKVHILGYETSPITTNEGGLHFSLYFEALDFFEKDFLLWMHSIVTDTIVFDENNNGQKNLDHFPPVYTSSWVPGNVYKDTITLQPPAASHQLDFGFLEPNTGEFLFLEGEEHGNNRGIVIDNIYVPGFMSLIPSNLNVTLIDDLGHPLIHVLGYRTYQLNASLKIDLYFEALKDVKENYIISMSGRYTDTATLQSEIPKGFVNFDHQPSVPTSQWLAGHRYRSSYIIKGLPRTYKLDMGIITPEGKHLRKETPNTGENRIDLGWHSVPPR